MLARTIKHRIILHIDFNSFFATVEQQANPLLRGKPVGVTGGDRMTRTVIGAASIEAKKFGVKTGMNLWEAQKLCPQIILVKGDSDKYLEVSKRFLNIVKDYSPYVEVFSIDEVFLELPPDGNSFVAGNPLSCHPFVYPELIALHIKKRIKEEIGEYITCSIGISYNKLMAKLAGSLKKPDGLIVIANEQEAMKVLDQIELNEICGIGYAIKKRLNNMGIFNFKDLRNAPLQALLASFKSYGQILYNMARGVDNSKVVPFYQKEEVKSIGHRYTLQCDTSEVQQIKQILLKLAELIARRLRAKKLVGKTVSCWFRYSSVIPAQAGIQKAEKAWIPYQVRDDRVHFSGEVMQLTIPVTQDGMEIFKAAWKIFEEIWDEGKVRMVGVSISNLKPEKPQNLSLLPEINRQETIIQAIDKVNNKFGEFTLQRGILLNSAQIKRKVNPFLSDHRFKFKL